MSVTLPPQWYAGITPSLADWQAAFAWAAGFTNEPNGFFYGDDGGVVRHIAGRFFIGGASDNPALRNRDATPTDWLSTFLHGTNVGAWPVWGAQAAALARFGTIGFLAASRTSDARANAIALGYPPSSAPASIGICGFAINDDTANPTSTTAWAGYFHAIRLPGVNYKPTFAIEAEAVNLGALPVGISTPYHINVGGGTYCMQLGSGGGHSNANAASGIFNVARNPAQFQQAINVGADALVGTDGSIGDTGYAAFISLGRNQGYQWYAPDGNVAAILRSTVTNSAHGSRIEFQDDAIVFTDAAGQEIGAIGSAGGLAFVKANSSLQLGSRGIADAPLVDFFTSGGFGRDARILASGGNPAVVESGGLDFYLGQAVFHGNLNTTAGTVNAFGGDLAVAGVTTTARTFITGVLTAGADVSVAGTLTAGGFLNVVGTMTTNALNAGGPVTAGGALNVVGATTLGGPVGIPGAVTFAGAVNVVHNGSAGEGVIALFGDGPITPNKYVRAAQGRFQVVNSAGSVALLDISDAGTLTAAGSIQGGLDLGIARNAAIQGLFSASGAATFGTTLNVAGALTAGAAFSVVGNTVHGGTTALNGKTTLGTGATINAPAGSMVVAANDAAAASGGVALGDFYICSGTTPKSIVLRTV